MTIYSYYISVKHKSLDLHLIATTKPKLYRCIQTGSLCEDLLTLKLEGLEFEIVQSQLLEV